MMLRSLLFIFIFLFAISAFAQEKNITLTFDSIYHVGINPAGELHVVSGKGITCFDKVGKVLQTVTVPNLSAITSFDSWHLTQEVVYYRANQKIEIYTPQLDVRNSFLIDSSFAIEPYLIAASTDEKHFWILDAADFSLKKVNPKTEEVLVDVALSGITNADKVISMREYQRFLFLRINSSLLIYNAMGKQIRTIDLPADATFDFFGEELFIVEKNSIRFINLFSPEQHQLTLSKSFRKVLLTDDRLFGVNSNTIEISEFHPD